MPAIANLLQESKEHGRLRLMHAISTVLWSAQSFYVLGRLTGKNAREISRSVKLTKRQVKLGLMLRERFVESFGDDLLLREHDEIAIMPPAILGQFLSKPAVVQIASGITSIPEAQIQRIVNQT